MANCEVKIRAFKTAATTTEKISEDTFIKNMRTQSQFVREIANTGDIIHSENFAEEAKDKRLLATAISKIKKMKEYGVYISASNSFLSSNLNRFMGNVVFKSEHLTNFVNTLNLKGQKSSTFKENIVDGRTNLTTQELNTMIKRYLGPILGMTNKPYVNVVGGVVKFNSVFYEDINEYQYQKYLSVVGILAEILPDHDTNTPKDFSDGILEMREAPFNAHINKSIWAKRKRIINLKGKSNYSTIEVAKLEVDIADLNTFKKLVKSELTDDMAKDYLEDILTDIESAIASKRHMDMNLLSLYQDSLDLIMNSGDTNPDVNNVLTLGEIYHKDTMTEMQGYANRAAQLKLEIAGRLHTAINEEAKLRQKGETTDPEKVTGLEDSLKRFFRKGLGIHHLGNPIIQYLYSLVSEAAITANYKARKFNDRIEKFYKKAVSSGMNMDAFIQETKDGEATGKLTDVFSSTYWNDIKGFTYKPIQRRKYMTALNPEILSREESDPDRKALLDTVYNDMGEYMGNMYIDLAMQKWEQYNNAKAGFLSTNPTTSEFQIWENRYSPIKRMQNYALKGKKVQRGSDDFLIIIPKRTINGRETGLYDKNFDEIRANDAAMEFYKETREVYVKNAEELGNKQHALKPPSLAYIGKSVSELVSKGDYTGAMNLAKEDLKQKYIPKEVASARKAPKDPITGQYSHKLQNEIHSIPAEIYRRVGKLLYEDAEYQALDDSIREDRERKTILEKEYRASVTAEVNAERSKDLLQSVVMANYANQEFLEKRVIETQVRVINNMVQNGAIKPVTDSTEGFKDSSKLLKELIQNYVDREFLGVTNEETSMRLSKVDKEGKAVTMRTVTNLAMTYGRTVVLGWSFVHALRNAGQQFFTLASLASTGDYFTLPELFSAYNIVLREKKAKNIVDLLYIVGDVAYSYDKRSIHEQSKLHSRLKPMYIQTKVEQLNQGVATVALMKTIMLKDTTTGSDIDLYSALTEDGELDDKYSMEGTTLKGLDLLVQLAADKIRPSVMRVSGDYLSPLLLERSEMGKLAAMFKKWMPEIILDRVHARRYDFVLDKHTEGKFFGAVKYLHSFASGRLDEVDKVTLDAARNAVYEIIMVTAMKLLYFAFAGITCDEPGCEESRGWKLATLNTYGQLTDDVLGLLNPMQWGATLAAPFALENTLNEWFQFTTDFGAYLIPGESGLYQQNGKDYEKGDAMFVRHLKKLAPIYRTNIYNLDKSSKEIKMSRPLRAFIED